MCPRGPQELVDASCPAICGSCLEPPSPLVVPIAADGLTISPTSDEPEVESANTRKAHVIPCNAVFPACRCFFEAEYELQRVLGHGVNGGVRMAVCKSTGHQVAVKFFGKHTRTTEERRSLQSELDLLAAMSHPNVVRLEAVYESEADVHMVMEKLHGGELFHHIERWGPLTDSKAAHLVVQVLDAVSHLHARHVVHRDIKLENLCYTDQNRNCIKLIDFGFAARCQPGEKLTGRIGSLGYVAPEVLAGRGYDESADLWSVGSVTYSVLTGMQAVSIREGSAEVLRRSEAGLVDFGKPFKRVSGEAKSFVRALLAPDPVARPTAEEALPHPWLIGLQPSAIRAQTRSEACKHTFLKGVWSSKQSPRRRPSNTKPVSGCFMGVVRSLVATLDSLKAQAASFQL